LQEFSFFRFRQRGLLRRVHSEYLSQVLHLSTCESLRGVKSFGRREWKIEIELRRVRGQSSVVPAKAGTHTLGFFFEF
jgi:hypothetical protein